MSPPDVKWRPGTPGQPIQSLPSDALIVVPVRNTVLFPEIVFPITLGRPATIAAAQQAVREQRQILIVLQREAGEGRSQGRTTSTASARSPTSCATSPRRTAAITW